MDTPDCSPHAEFVRIRSVATVKRTDVTVDIFAHATPAAQVEMRDTLDELCAAVIELQFTLDHVPLDGEPDSRGEIVDIPDVA